MQNSLYGARIFIQNLEVRVISEGRIALFTRNLYYDWGRSRRLSEGYFFFWLLAVDGGTIAFDLMYPTRLP